MRAGRVEEAGALAERIGKDMKRQSKNRLKTINGKTDVKDMWAAVRQLTGRKQDTGPVAGITAESLNSHYVAISTDNHYKPPVNKQSVAPSQLQYISSWRVFQILDHLHPTATGLDQLPAWFLRIGAPLFYEPITRSALHYPLQLSRYSGSKSLSGLLPKSPPHRSLLPSGLYQSPQSSHVSWNEPLFSASSIPPSSLPHRVSHSLINSLSVHMARLLLQLYSSSTQSPTCYSPIHM